MRITHGLIIPDKDYLMVDVETLLGYMHLVIFGYFECLSCGRQRNTAQAAQQHMIGRSHCKIDNLSEGSEFRDFYDFDGDEADAGEEGHGEGDGDAEVRAQPHASKAATPQFVQLDDATLRLQSGKVVSHKKYHSHRPHKRQSDLADRDNATPIQPGTFTDANSSDSTDLTLTTVSGSVVKTRAEKRDNIFTTRQLANLRAEDRRSLMHLPTSQQRAILANQQQQVEKARREERAMKRRVERMGNRTLMMHFVNDVPGRLNG
jgi:pre-60S factor REI1